NPDYHVWVVGHSLGGAQALAAAVDVIRRHSDWKVSVIPSGQPRLGNPVFVEYVNKLPLTIYRVTNKNDQVPRLPLRSMGYAHVNTEYWIK
ncbi:alpha/beta-hydrolase, partial [Ramicandelaber brevisporus]